MEEICEFCKKPCTGKWIDYGLGLDEAWGSVIHHSDVRYVSDCCHADLNDVELGIYSENIDFDEPLEPHYWEE